VMIMVMSVAVACCPALDGRLAMAAAAHTAHDRLSFQSPGKPGCRGLSPGGCCALLYSLTLKHETGPHGRSMIQISRVARASQLPERARWPIPRSAA
jgi:hypothetical protein